MFDDLTPIGGPADWRGDALAARGFWPRHLTSEEVAALDTGLAEARRRNLAPPCLRPEHFPAAPLRSLLAAVAEELEHGAGVVRLSGLPVERYSAADLKTLFWGLCGHLGTPLHQNTRGEVLAEVRDETGHGLAVTGGGPGPVPSARARSRSTGPLRWHTDKCDVLALLCASNGIAGGVSKVVSTVAIQDEIARRDPALLAVLYREFWRMRPQDEEGGGAPDSVFPLPVFSRGPEGGFTSQYSRTYVEMAHDQPGVPPIRPDQVAALDLLAEVADALHVAADFAPGDIQLLNQHITYHGRTAYADDAAAGAQRMLLRIWLAVPNSRALPAGHAVQWGATAAGALRGGAIRARSAFAD